MSSTSPAPASCLGYPIAKYGMSLCTLGLAAEFADAGIAASSLWPRTTIGTDAVANLLGGEQALARSRTPQIMADAAYAVLTTPARERTGQFLIDEDVLREAGITDSSSYAVDGRGHDLEKRIVREPCAMLDSLRVARDEVSSRSSLVR